MAEGEGSTLPLRSGLSEVEGMSLSDVVERGPGVGLVPNICDAPFLYERWMFSLLCEGDVRPPGCTAVGTKNGEAPDMALSAGECSGGLFDGGDVFSDLIQGPGDRCSEIAESTGD